MQHLLLLSVSFFLGKVCHTPELSCDAEARAAGHLCIMIAFF